MENIRADHPLRRWFGGLVEQTFCTEVGMCDPVLTDYVTDLLVEFTHVDRLNAIRNADGKRLEQIAAMLAVASPESAASAEDRDRTMYRHIGDYTLFWAGVYPEQIGQTARRQSDVLLDFVTQGKRSYAIVSELATKDSAPPARLFRHLSEEFEICLHGLGLVRKGWERKRDPSANPGGDLIY